MPDQCPTSERCPGSFTVRFSEGVFAWCLHCGTFIASDQEVGYPGFRRLVDHSREAPR